MSFRLTRSRILAVGILAFAGGVFFASSMDWTDHLFAQGSPSAARPRQEQVQTLADASNAFVSISEHVTPAVVAISAERDARVRPNNRRQGQTPQGPADATEQARCKPIYEEMEGWNCSTRGARSWADLPAQAVKYVRRVEELIGAPVALLSTSPEREDTIMVRDPFVDR